MNKKTNDFMIKDALSAKISNMSFVCSIMVVLIHSPRATTVGSIEWMWTTVVQNGICQMAVPYFFLVSGFFLAKQVREGASWWKVEIKKRIRSLLIPFFIFNFLYSMCKVILFANNLWTWKHWAALFISTIGFIPFGGVSMGSLWYIRTLIILVLISPLLYRFATWFGLLILFAIYAVFYPYPFECMQEWCKPFFLSMLSPIGLAYFTLGIYIRRKVVLDCLLNIRIKFKYPLIVSYCLLIIFRCIAVFYNWHWVIVCYLGFLSIPIAILIGWMLMPSTKWSSAITSCAFPLYLIHGFVILFLEKFWGEFIMSNVFIGVLCVMTFSFVLVGILRACGTRVGNILFAGR